MGEGCVGRESHPSTGDWARAFANRRCHSMSHIGDLMTPLVHLPPTASSSPKTSVSSLVSSCTSNRGVDIASLDASVPLVGYSRLARSSSCPFRSRPMHIRLAHLLAAWVCIGCGNSPSLRVLPFVTIAQDCLDYCMHLCTNSLECLLKCHCVPTPDYSVAAAVCSAGDRKRDLSVDRL